MHIRKAIFSDIRKIKSIADKCSKYVYALPLSAYHLLVAYPFSKVLVAKEGERVAGYLIAFQNPITMSVYFYQLAVDPEFRKRGISTALSKKMTERLRGGSKVSLAVRKNNRKALKYYKNRGFKVAVRDFWFDMVKLRKSLNGGKPEDLWKCSTRKKKK